MCEGTRSTVCVTDISNESESIEIQYESSERVSVIKIRLKTKLSMRPSDNLDIIYNNKRLDDNMTLLECGYNPKTQLYYEPVFNQLSDSLVVTDLLRNTESISIKYHRQEKVSAFKQRLKKDKLHVSEDHQIVLFHNNLILLDEKSLVESGVQPNTTLQFQDFFGFEEKPKLEEKRDGRCESKIFKATVGNESITLYRYKLDGELQRIEEYKPIMDEIIAVKQVGEHENIVQLRALYQQTLSTKNYFFVGFEYFGNGDLENFIKKNGRRNENEIFEWIYQILNALSEIHKRKVIHGDIRCCNIFLCDDKKTVKLANFTLAKYMEGCGSRSLSRGMEISKTVGSTRWMAPEVNKENKLSSKSDMWSLGATIIEMLSGENPYLGLGDIQAVIKTDAGQPPEYTDSPPLSPFFGNIIKDCFQPNPGDRLSAEALIEKFDTHKSTLPI